MSLLRHGTRSFAGAQDDKPPPAVAPNPRSLFLVPVPCPLFPIPCSLFPVPVPYVTRLLITIAASPSG